MDVEKICIKCGQRKPATTDYFPHRKGHLTARCKSCVKDYKAQNYKENADKIKSRSSRYYANNRERVLNVRRTYRENNRKELVRKSVEYKRQNPHVAKSYRLRNLANIKDKQKNYYALNRDEIRARERAKYKANKSEIRTKRNRYFRGWSKSRRKNNPVYRLSCNLRGRLNAALYGVTKSKSTFELLGCDPAFLWAYLETKFTDGMTRDNYGSHWHVDHIRPLASFDLIDPEEQKRAFHYTNLQPLEAMENIRKGAKYGGRDFKRVRQSNSQPYLRTDP